MDNNLNNSCVEVTITHDNIHIENSYRITNKDGIKWWLYYLEVDINSKAIDCIVFEKRTRNSLIKEWIAHNVLYKLHIARSHTKSVDLNIERWYRILCYNIIYFVYKLLNYFVSK